MIVPGRAKPETLAPIVVTALRGAWAPLLVGAVTSTASTLATSVGLVVVLVLVPQGQAAVAGIVFVALLAASSGFGILADRSSRVLRARLLASIEQSIWGRLLQRPIHFFSSRSIRQLLSFAGGVSVTRRLAGPLAVDAVLAALSTGFATVALAVIDASLAIRAVVVAIGVGAFVTQMAHRQQRHDAAVMDGVEAAQATLYPALVGYEEILGYQSSAHVHQMWRRVFTEQKRADRAGLRCGDAATAVLRATPAIFVSVLCPSSIATHAGLLGIGATAIVALQAGSAVTRMIPVIPALFSLTLVSQRLAPVLAASTDQRPERTVTLSSIRGEIALAAIRFSHPHAHRTLLRDANMTAPAGSLTAIIGASGSGKSTVLQLILGLTLPDSGQVTIDGVPVDRIVESDLRRQLGYVPQSGTLLRGTLRDAVRGFRTGLDDAAIVRAMVRAGLGSLLQGLPMGLDTPISDGHSGFSGGQEQRILIARALVADPAVLLLDEATSALDSATESDVAAAIAELPMTRIVVAHRLSTVLLADQILLLQDGQLVRIHTRDPDRLAALVAGARPRPDAAAAAPARLGPVQALIHQQP